MNDKKNYKQFTFRALKTIASVGAVAAVMILPGLAIAFTPFVTVKRGYNRKRIAHNKALQTIWRLRRQGLIKKDSRGKLSLTTKGQRLLVRYQLKELAIKKPKRWDGKWRMVAFDVWETRRSTRDLLRKILIDFGFVKLQNSLWVYPYDCEEIIELLRTHLRVSPAVYYFVVEKIDKDRWLRKHFGLPR